MSAVSDMISSQRSSSGSIAANAARSVLLVEDSPSQAATYTAYLAKAGYQVDHAPDGEAALSYLAVNSPDVIILDLRLPGIQGTDVLKHARSVANPPPVIVITDYGSIDVAVDAMRDGASDFVTKPFGADQIRVCIENTLIGVEYDDRSNAPHEVFDHERFHGFRGSSALIQSVYRIIQSAASSKATVFITGESGTGKELCARALHHESPRAERPFIELNCAAIPKSLMESEIFGYEKGAFTGAESRHDGAAIRADGGTLFLDEICDMDLELQAKLLRFIQSGSVYRVGADEPQQVDVRFVCATNRDPLEEVAIGRFREDLYYRLHVVPLTLPALRELKNDIVLIADALLRQISQEEGKRFERFCEDSKRLLLEYDWPGNVRQLQNVVRNIVVLNDAQVVTREMFPDLGAPEFRSRQESVAGSAAAAVRALKDVERDAIEDAIAACDGNIPRAAGLLGVSPSTIYRKIQSWGRSR